jgi:hypothetical protein
VPVSTPATADEKRRRLGRRIVEALRELAHLTPREHNAHEHVSSLRELGEVDVVETPRVQEHLSVGGHGEHVLLRPAHFFARFP